MRKILCSLAAMIVILATVVLFTSCGNDDDHCGRTVKEACVTTSVYVNEDFTEAFTTYAITEDGKEIVLSPTPTDVVIKGKKMCMYALTAECSSHKLPHTAIMNVRYIPKDINRLPEHCDFAIAAIASGEIIYSDGTCEKFCSQWCEGEKRVEHCHDCVEYNTYINGHFNYINATIDHHGIDLSTYSKNWCGTSFHH